jgi:hypothetical protein
VQALWTLLAFLLQPWAVELPTAVMDVITAQMIRTSITAYSAAVTPSSSEKKARTDDRHMALDLRRVYLTRVAGNQVDTEPAREASKSRARLSKT